MRIRRCLTPIVVALTALAVTTAHAGTPPPPSTTPFDWQVVVLTAGPAGAHNVNVIQGFVGSSTDNDQVDVLGVGIPGDHESYGFSDDFPWDPQTPAVRTTHDLGGVEVTLVQQSGPHWVSTGVGSLVPDMHPHETMAFLFAAAHAQLKPFQLDIRAAGGSVGRVRIHRGTGTDYLRLADAQTTGAGAAVGPAAVGIMTRTMTARSAIVGSTTYGDQGYADGSWQAPSGPAHPFVQYFLPVAACADRGNWFSGPAGTWTWTVRSAMTYPGTPVLAAYAPVGSLAKLFPAWQPFTNGSPCTAI